MIRVMADLGQMWNRETPQGQEINVIVTDERNHPVQGAEVIVQDPKTKGPAVQSAITDDHGKARLVAFPLMVTGYLVSVIPKGRGAGQRIIRPSNILHRPGDPVLNFKETSLPVPVPVAKGLPWLGIGIGATALIGLYLLFKDKLKSPH